MAQTHLVEAPILMYLSIHPLYSSSYIIQVQIRDCQLAGDLGPKLNSSDENSHDSKLLWINGFLWHTGSHMNQKWNTFFSLTTGVVYFGALNKWDYVCEVCVCFCWPVHNVLAYQEDSGQSRTYIPKPLKRFKYLTAYCGKRRILIQVVFYILGLLRGSIFLNLFY